MKTSFRYIGHGGVLKFLVECGTDEEAHLAKASLGQIHHENRKMWLEPTVFVQNEALIYVSTDSIRSVDTAGLEDLAKRFEAILGRIAKISKVYELTLNPVDLTNPVVGV